MRADPYSTPKIMSTLNPSSRKKTPYLVILILALAATPAAWSQTTLEIPASANTFVLRSSSGTIQNSSQSLLTKRLNDSNARVAYLRFDLTSFFNAHSTNDVQSVRLRLYQTSGTVADTVRVYGLNDVVTNVDLWPNGQSDSVWSPATMVFTNQPAGTNLLGQITSSASALPNTNTTPLLGSQPIVAAPPSVEVDVTLDPQTFINFLAADSNKQITLVFHTTANNGPAWASISNTSGNLVPTLEIVAASGAGGLVWSGNINADWDTTTKNWLDTNGAAASFTSGNGAIFDDSSAVTAVNLTAALLPQTVTFSNNVNTYTLGGSGKLSGAASLVLNGSGTAILNETGGNDFNGGISINSGTLQIGNGGAGGNPGIGGITDNGSLVFNRSGSVIVSGAISGTGTLTQQGPGTTILAGGNTYSGSTVINGGTLQVGNGNVTGSLGTADVTDNGTLAFNRTNNISVALNISGTGGLTQSGAGSLILSGTESYSGLTVVNTGALLVNGTLSSSTLVTNDVAGTLGGTGSINAPVRSRGQINPGPINAAGTLTINGPLTLDSGAALRFDLSSDNSINDVLQVNDNLNLNNNVIQANFLGAPNVGTSYQVLAYTGTKTGNFNPLAGGTHFTVTVNDSIPNQVSLLVGGSGANLKWNSTANTNWDTGVSSNWLNGALSDVFYGGDSVLFDDSVPGVATNINLVGNLSPAAVTNNSSANYTFGGSGVINGSASVVKKGSGTLTMGGANHGYTGPTIISGGVLTVPRVELTGAASPIGAGQTILDGGTLRLTAAGGLSISHDLTLTTNGGTLDFSSTGSGASLIWSLSGTLTLPDNGPRTLIFAGTDPVPLQLGQGSPFSQVIGDSPDAQPTTIVKNGNCAWRFPSANSYTGGIQVNQGRATALNASSFGTGPVTVTNGGEAFLAVGSTFGNNFSISGPGVLQQFSGELADYQGALHLAEGSHVSGVVTLTGDARIGARGANTTGGSIDGQLTGNFTVEFGHADGTGAAKSGNGIVDLTSSLDDWSGNTIISHGMVKIGGAGEVIPNGAGKGNVIMNGSGTFLSGNILSVLDLDGLSETVNGLSSSNAAALCLITNSSGGPALLVAGDNDASSSFGGSIVDDVTDGLGSIALTKTGSGTLALTGSNAYSGQTIVSNGTLIVSGSVGAVALSNNATLGGAATLHGDLIANSTGTISPGTSGATGSLTVTGAAQLDGTTRMKLNAATGTNDEIVAGTLSYGGTLIVSNLGGTLTNGATFQLFGSPAYPATSFGSITLPALNTGLGWQTNLTVDGTIKVVSVSAPVSPTIGSISVSGGNVIISGTNNTGASGTYHVLTATNIALPLSNWTVLTNGNFDNGNFSSTNATGTSGRQFYILQVP
jgi:autotransporter-associated beta strand protein